MKLARLARIDHRVAATAANLAASRGLAVVLVLSVACSARPKATEPTSESKPVIATPDIVPADSQQEPNGLVLEVRQTEAEEAAPEANVVAKTTPLTDKDVARLLERLPPLAADAGQQTTFAVRDKSLPVPKTGVTEQLPFPPKQTDVVAPVPHVEVRPLSVRRFGPTGDVPIAAELSVTFSQPMVAVGTVDEAKENVPIKMSPSPDGQWKWLGTETVVFAPTVRMPMATSFAIEIPKGTKSANGGMLAEAVKWQFTTPPLTLAQALPRDTGGQPLEPLIFIGFDQRIEPKVLLSSVKVDAKGSLAIRLATDAEIAADATVSSVVKQSEPGRFMVIRAEKPLPMAAKVTVTVKAGAPSAEGPLKTKKDQTFSFDTYGPFLSTGASCWSDPCVPDSSIQVGFTNTIDAASYKDSMVHIDPPFAAQIRVHGSTIQINGRKKSNTTYAITVDAGLRDTYGQTLASPAKLSVKVGNAVPQLSLAREGFATISPDGPRIDVMSAGQAKIHIAVYKVDPSQWHSYIEFLQKQNSSERAPPPGILVRNDDVVVHGDTDDLVATAVDLTPALTKGSGNVVVVASGLRRHRKDVSNVSVWVQVTNLGLDAFADDTDLTAWVTDLATGKPVDGATVELASTKTTVKTNGDGVARLELPEYVSATPMRVLVAHHGDDKVMLPASQYYWDHGHWHKSAPSSSPLLWMTDDRGMYKPGESAHFKGFVRSMTGGKNGQLGAFDGKELAYTISDVRGNEIGKGTTQLSKLGGFDFEAKFADNVNLGNAYVRMQRGDDYIGDHHFQIQEFRRPEFEVGASVNDGVHIIGESQNATVKASYYSGGPLTGAPVRWRVSATNASFTPPGRDAFVFGIWQPWWHSYRGDGGGTLASTLVKGTTDARGMHRIAIDPKSMKPHRATSIDAEATVTDVNRQAWTAKATMLVHAASTYVGIKPERMFVEVGKQTSFDLIAVDLDGKALVGRDIHLRVVRDATVVKNGQSSREEVEEASVSVASQAAPARWMFTPKEGGLHHVSADVTDDKGRVNHSELMLWVPGEKRPEVSEVKHEELTLIPSQKEYAPGDTAEILVQSPFAPAEGLVLIERGGLLTTQRVSLTTSSTTVRVPVTDAYVPNFTVAIELAGSAPDPKTKKLRPTFASGHLDFTVSSKALALTVDVAPQSRGVSPGESTMIVATVKDAKGKSVADAEVTLIVVDEAVLALSSFTLSDPLAAMLPHRSAAVNSVYLRDSVLIARPEKDGDTLDAMKESEGKVPPELAAPAPAMLMSAPGGFGAAPKRMRALVKKEGAAQPEMPIAMRTDFSALAAFVPKLVTDGNGRVTTTVKLPDSLTRYRVMAIAVGSVRQFGKGESTITARLPLMVRPSAPRFLNFGDMFELPAIVHNQTEQAMDVDVVLRATNLEVLTKGLRVHVGAGARVEVRFPAKTVAAGTAHFQIGAASGKAADAADQRLKVWTPATSEAFATYGVLDGNATIVQPIAAPADVFPEAGGLTLSASSTAMQSLTDAILYLTQYPFDCSEQLASRILTVVAMKDVLAAFDTPGLPKPAEIAASVARDVQLLQARQTANGGFGFWSRDHVSPYTSIHVAHALVRAKSAGFPVDAGMLERSLRYAANVEADLADYHPSVREVIVAYALNVRARAGDVDLEKAREILGKGVKKLSVETLGFVQPVFHRGHEDKAVQQITKELERRVTETASSAHFVTNYADGAHLILASDKRSDAVVLGALMETAPKTDLIPKVVRGLLDGRRKGRWYTTQENVFVLLALGDYFNQFEKRTPEFVARLWLGADYAGQAEFHGRETTTRELVVPMAKLVTAAKDLTVQKEGQGRLYYRIGLDYAPKSLDLSARDNGFEVERTYEAVDDPSNVRRDDNGVWHVKAGAKVRVKLTMVAPSVRYHVALVDPLPAGFEAVNTALAVSERDPSQPEDPGDDDDVVQPMRSRGRSWSWWRSSWYEHQNLRDERVEAFGTEVWAGVHTYTYVARATTPGTYIVPPTKAEEMYAPETFGRSATTRVTVE